MNYNRSKKIEKEKGVIKDTREAKTNFHRKKEKKKREGPRVPAYHAIP